MEGWVDSNEHDPLKFSSLKYKKSIIFLTVEDRSFQQAGGFAPCVVSEPQGPFVLRLYLPCEFLITFTVTNGQVGSHTQERGRKAGSCLKVSSLEVATPLQLTFCWLKLTPMRLGRAVELCPPGFNGQLLTLNGND